MSETLLKLSDVHSMITKSHKDISGEVADFAWNEYCFYALKFSRKPTPDAFLSFFDKAYESWDHKRYFMIHFSDFVKNHFYRSW